MWGNTVERGRPHVTVWRMRILCRIPDSTNTHSEYVIHIANPLHQQLHKRAPLLRYTTAVYVLFQIET
jgi:hypothetical protein